MTLTEGTIKRLHVNSQIIKRNALTGARDPVLTVKHKGQVHRTNYAEILGHSTLRYEPEHPLACGARVWLETHAAVVLE